MPIIIITVCKQGGSDKQKSHHEVPDDVTDLVSWGKAKVDEMNKDKAGFEKPYVLNGVSEYKEPDPTDPAVHDWRKNSFDLTGAEGGYHLVKCEKCGITGTKYDKNLEVVIDRHYKAKYYSNCAEVIKRNKK